MINNKLKTIVYVISMTLMVSCSQESDDTKQSTNSEITAEKSKIFDQQKAPMSLSENFEKATKTLFQNRAVSATLFGVSDEVAGLHSKSELENYSPQKEAAFRRDISKVAANLNAIKTDSKTDEENRKVVADIVSYYAGAADFPQGFIDSWMGHSAFIVNQINGPLIDIPNNLINSHTIKNRKDAEDYLERLENFSQMLKSINQKLKEDAKSGWIPPKVIVNKSIAYLDGFSKIDIEKASLVTSFTAKIASLKDLSEEKKLQMGELSKTLVSEFVYPGYQAISATLSNLLEKATTESGIWAQPNGAAFYQYSITKLGNTDLSADEIHQIGLKEVDRIVAEMDHILVGEGYREGSVGERMTALNDEQRFLYANTDEGRAELLAYLNETINEISKIMPQQFASVPPYPVEVKRIPVATQDSSAGGYYTPPSLDASVPGIYWINLRNTKTNPKFDLKTLTYHEAVPGHHWQVALNLAQEQLPLLRRIAPYNAYVEGWALYSEQVAFEMGLYKNDPFGNLGRLKAELFRAVRLVVDTGIHSKQWSREKAIEFMASTTGTEKSDVVSEIERYMVWPGQALGYKLGMLKILSLREYAKTKLAGKFDIKEFHDVVLLSGAVPMKVLDENVKAWVESSL